MQAPSRPQYIETKARSTTSTTTPSRGLSMLLHAAGLASFAATFIWLPHTTNPLHRGVGGPFQFLTVIALSLSTVVFALGLVADMTQSSRLAYIKTTLSVRSATPLALLVAMLYWSNRAAAAGMLIPRGHEVPFVPDLGLHVIPVVALTTDLLWPRSTAAAFAMAAVRGRDALAHGVVLMFAYWAWLEYCFSYNGWYPYPGLEKMSRTDMFVACLASACLMAGNAVALKKVYMKVSKGKLEI
ncbi:FAR-17a/AIG1-like protein [Apiospora sp. TS-2023a]